MSDSLRIALAQINPTVGDLAGNAERVLAAVQAAGDVDLVVCPELVISGYPPEDLVLRKSYVAACRDAAEAVAAATRDGPAVIIGTPWPTEGGGSPRALNVALLCADGEIAGRAVKCALPNYGVFDEPRTFRSGVVGEVAPIPFKGTLLGLMTCEDMWVPGPATRLVEQGAQILIVPHGSPFRMSAHVERLFQAEARVAETGVPLLFVNQVGGQDELVFDGGAFVAVPGGTSFCAPLFEEGQTHVTFTPGAGALSAQCAEGIAWPRGEALLWPALVLATRDYVRKSGFSRVVLGLSGGIDSAVVAAIAVDALGPENVRCVMMPSRYTSEESLEDAAACASALGIRYDTIVIEEAVGAFTGMLAPLFDGLPPDVTEENLQSRIRGVTLMALSNKFGALLLSTGNKSEMGVGYATLYGDMNGAFNPLKDVYKTQVFRLAAWRNAHLWDQGLGPGGDVIPVRILEKPPSAELRADQRDEDSLPPYEVLDAILHGLVEDDLSVAEIVARGFDGDEVARVHRLLRLSEYKRAQSPPGPKVTSRNFGRDRRYPIVNAWAEISSDKS